jgi:hypothetical protein
LATEIQKGEKTKRDDFGAHFTEEDKTGVNRISRQVI